MIRVVRRSTLRELREASPLTGLPGNTRIRRELSGRISAHQPFALCHLDIDRFKSVNDTYGFVRGDELILLLAAVLRRTAAGEFIGHVGGDDFVVICGPRRAEALLNATITEFERRVPAVYDPAHAQQGYLTTVDRRGETRKWELATLSVGVATSEHRRYADPAEVVSAAAEMKSVAKREPGSHVAVDRRRT
ncbi:GGDEF domain-containing protein [Longispora albida]|uniref:GGDEF domain-containing protein n=1 Tax=Longispora albida TaxID=203523 RepID=UPI000365F22D|nr:GGDEF domain-containing protein [Longispora albida]